MIKEGLSKSAIARKLGISRDTVAKYAKLPEGHIPVIKRQPAGTTVDAYLPHIAGMLIKAHELDVHIPSTAIYEEIKKMGYKGSLRWMLEVERGSTIITSNLVFSQWSGIFANDK